MYYVRLLRETVWPGGTFFSSNSEEKTAEEKEATRTLAKRMLVDFFPKVLPTLLGRDVLDDCAQSILESLQYTQLNKSVCLSKFCRYESLKKDQIIYQPLIMDNGKYNNFSKIY